MTSPSKTAASGSKINKRTSANAARYSTSINATGVPASSCSCLADVLPLVEHFAHHGIDHVAHQPGGRAAFIQLLRNGLAFADQGELVIEQAGEQLQLIVGQMGL